MKPVSQTYKVLLLLAISLAACSAVSENFSGEDEYSDGDTDGDYVSHEQENLPKQLTNETFLGVQSANFAAHNESCSPTGKKCESVQNMECSSTDGTGRCRCVSGWVHVSQTDTCWKVVNSDQDTCSHDVQCHGGKMGRLSRCDKHTKRCECFDYSSGGKRETVVVGGVCFIKKVKGDTCTREEDDGCADTIRGVGAFCKFGNDSHGVCDCMDESMYWSPLNACLKLATNLGDTCHINDQCQMGTLGRHSRCNSFAKCECHTPHDGKETVYFGGVCYIRKVKGDRCTPENDDCGKTIGGGGAFCKIGDDSQGTCDCLDEYIYSDRLNSCLKLATKLNDPCVINEQCQNGSLGSYSRCSNFQACECYSPLDESEMAYYDNRCFKKKNFNDICQETDECKASLGPDLECGFTEDHIDNMVCHCSAGKFCRNSQSSAFSNFILSSSYGVRFASVTIIIANFARLM